MDEATMAWVKHQVNELTEKSTDEGERALLLATLQTIEEQDHRLTLAAGELDGRAWGDKRSN
ncbi:hypothetical protein [Limosilactobacillus fermentum]|uniref:hypothetical protein n=1 Tax=Limosilactobacillus fermentum TaxID=1613 RepID=UPI0030CEE59C